MALVRMKGKAALAKPRCPVNAVAGTDHFHNCRIAILQWPPDSAAQRRNGGVDRHPGGELAPIEEQFGTGADSGYERAQQHLARRRRRQRAVDYANRTIAVEKERLAFLWQPVHSPELHSGRPHTTRSSPNGV